MVADTNNGGVGGGVHATSFPINFASTMTWDPQLTYQETTAISDEARGFLDKSLWGTAQNNLGPSHERLRDADVLGADGEHGPRPPVGPHGRGVRRGPLPGRPDGGRVRGRLPGRDDVRQPLTPYLKVAATAKHFALNNNENNRHADSSNTTDANIRDYYTAQFRSLVENAHVAGDHDLLQRRQRHAVARRHLHGQRTAAAHLRVQRVHHLRLRSRRRHLQPRQPRLGAARLDHQHHRRHHLDQHRDRAADQPARPAAGLRPPGRHRAQLHRRRARRWPTSRPRSRPGCCPKGVIDNALVHLFTMRMQTGEFDPPGKVAYTKITKAVIQSPAHQALAEKVAADDLVLLKNDNVAGRRRRCCRPPVQAEQRGHRGQPGQHGHPGRLLR